MTTTLTYASIQLGFSPLLAAADTTGEATQEDIAAWITDGDIDVEIRTATTIQSNARDHLIKEYVKCRYMEHCRLWLAKGGTRLAGAMNADLAADIWVNYRQLIKDFNASESNTVEFTADGNTYDEE